MYWPMADWARNGVGALELVGSGEVGLDGVGEVDRRFVVEAERLGPLDHAVLPEVLDRHPGERAVAGLGQDLEQRAAARVGVPDRLAVGRVVGVFDRVRGRVRADHVELQAAGADDDLEGRPGEVAVLVRGGDERRARAVGLQEGPGRPGRLEVVGGQGVGVVRGVVPQGQHGPGPGVDGHHGPPALAQLLPGLRLEVVVHGGDQVADLVLVDEQVGEAPQLLLGGVPDQLLGVALLQPGGPELERVEAGDGGEQVARRIAPLEVVLVVHLDRLGDDHAVGRRDRPPVAGEVLPEAVDVLRFLAQRLSVEDLHPVEHPEDGQVAGGERDAEAADPGVHADTVCRWRRPSRSDWRRVVSSEIRSSRAMIT